jgi:hypothetical protein
MILFDGHDPGAVETARAQWRTLTGRGGGGEILVGGRRQLEDEGRKRGRDT